MAFKAFVIFIIVSLMVLTISAVPLELPPAVKCQIDKRSFFDGCNVCKCSLEGKLFGCTKGPCPPSIPIGPFFSNILVDVIEKICSEEDTISRLQCDYMFKRQD
ncbi:uncharacterized protein LOC118647269 [Monomorium pharaonis]|uniref:uncharacterized protein LOC118647269 n=1 Tax=Monomorium pharaonis TaxID=307658 RepID=UPI0017478BD4|nr:uncharacterized protein LOC118647269 [Monomorium pharaonis]